MRACCEYNFNRESKSWNLSYRVLRREYLLLMWCHLILSSLASAWSRSSNDSILEISSATAKASLVNSFEQISSSRVNRYFSTLKRPRASALVVCNGQTSCRNINLQQFCHTNILPFLSLVCFRNIELVGLQHFILGKNDSRVLEQKLVWLSVFCLPFPVELIAPLQYQCTWILLPDLQG